MESENVVKHPELYSEEKKGLDWNKRRDKSKNENGEDKK